jgi:hypothetical protein
MHLSVEVNDNKIEERLYVYAASGVMGTRCDLKIFLLMKIHVIPISWDRLILLSIIASNVGMK